VNNWLEELEKTLKLLNCIKQTNTNRVALANAKRSIKRVKKSIKDTQKAINRIAID